ncbi:Exosome complex component RRP42 [Sarcoptes scabiei]|uniref:Ribosomal RNA-processing protein 42 n=1 Tax=Sarcoptes scabiei TaxID=52283 RepID=A0A834VE22_SARSC|nr:Exosome complex component RRP42 [Sarcoptes scabiei]
MSISIEKISEGERIFITHGVDLNLRNDGRTCDDFRMILIEQGVIETCSGSAHVRSGNTDVLVGIKLESETASEDADNEIEGRIEVFADISAIASPAFEGKKGEDITCQIESLFSSFLVDYLDLKKLTIVPNKSYFVLHIDIVILECSSLSSLIDITSIAIKTALTNLRIPKINILSANQNEFTVSEDEFDSIELDASKVPLITSYTKIGSKFVVDPTWEEEQASVGTIVVAFVPPDQTVLIKKIRHGSIGIDSLPILYERALKFGSEMLKKFEERISILNQSKNRGRITFSLN